MTNLDDQDKAEVWILHLTWAPDWPREKFTSLHGVYTTYKAAKAEKDSMIDKHDNKVGPGITGWDIGRHYVEGESNNG